MTVAMNNVNIILKYNIKIKMKGRKSVCMLM